MISGGIPGISQILGVEFVPSGSGVGVEIGQSVGQDSEDSGIPSFSVGGW